MSLNPCQPGGNVSCAACCGLYADRLGEAAVSARLAERSDALLGRSVEHIRATARSFAPAKATSLGMGQAVGHCALAGYLDAQRGRVGCLGHRLVTGSVDLRDLGNFGAFGCEAFQCPSVGVVTDEEIAFARDSTGWWLYGLVITDARFLRACVAAARAAAGEEKGPRVLAALRALFALKAGSAPHGEGGDPSWDLKAVAQGALRGK